MSEIFPAEGAPNTPEVLSFPPEDSELMVGAVAYYTTSDLRTYEANWGSEGYDGMMAGADVGLDKIDRYLEFVRNGYDLAAKIRDHRDDPTQPLELNNGEIERLGFSLYRLGNSGYGYANQALESGRVRPVGDGEPRRTLKLLQARQSRSFELFKTLEPLAQARGAPWMVWESPDQQ